MSAPDEPVIEPTRRSDPLIGHSVLGYRLKRPIGVGGMGIVYEAEEPNIGRRAAVKVLLPEVADQPELVERLKAEARAANAARHRGIVDIFGFATLPDGRHAIVMEYLEGIALEEYLANLAAEGRRAPVLLSLMVLDEVAAVLQAAHDARVTHRDLKPSNIFLCSSVDGSQYVKVLDFGIAKLEGPQNTVKTATNVVMGTPTYMAPEQARGDAAAPSMDLYSLGVVGFELFTGRVPFLETATVKLLMAHQQQKPPVPSSLSPGLPSIVDDFLLKLLAKDPAQRYRSGNEVRAAVQQLRKVLGDTTASVTQPAMERPPGLSQVVAIGRAASRSPGEEGSMTQPAMERVQGLSQVVAVARAAPAVSSHPTTSDEALVAPMRRSSPLWLVSAGLVVVIGVLSWVLLKSPAPSPPEPIAAAVAVAEPVPVKPPPAEPVVVPTPVVAPAVVQAAPDAGVQTSPPPRAAPTGVEPRKRALERRLAALTVRLDAAQARGESVGLATQQLSALKKGLKNSRDAARLDAIETATQRLEEENP